MKLHVLARAIRDAYSSDQRVAIYGAAGISKDCPTHLPLGGELSLAVISGFLEMGTGGDLSLLRRAVKGRTLEEICGIVQDELEDKRKLVAKMSRALDNDELVPNCNHRFMARALHDGHLVVTTNYDAMIERAYRELHGLDFPTDRICYDEATFEPFLQQPASLAFRRSANENGWLLKLHGTFHLGRSDKGYSVMATLDRVGQGLPPKAEEALIQVLRQCPLVVLGYGCMDIDIVYPVLDNTRSVQPIWWVKHSDGMTRIYDYAHLEDMRRKEEKKSTRDIDVRTLNAARVLHNRGTHNGGKVWQIRALTSQVTLALKAQLGGSFGQDVKPCTGDEESWRDELRRLGSDASDSERLHVLARLAQACGPYESGGRDIYDLSTRLFAAALEKVGDDSRRSRIYREMGWNTYRKDPEKNSAQAIVFYDMAERLLPQDGSTWLSRVTIQSLKALAYRRARRMGEALRIAEEASGLLPSFVRSGESPSGRDVFRAFLKRAGIAEANSGAFGAVLRRLAGVFDQSVAGPATLATAIRCEYQWTMHEQETKALQRAKKLLETDRALQATAGEPIQKIQSENQLGLVYSKLGEGEAAAAVHEDSCRMAKHFGRWYEYAQALRNQALAEEVLGHFGEAISHLKEAMELFEGREDDIRATLWHLGRVRIKNKDEIGLENIDQHRVHRLTERSWHWKANDYALLGIGCVDLKSDLAVARRHFASMIEQYTAETDIDISNQTYGVDNALANVVAASERLSKDKGAESLDVRTELVQLRQRLERLRSHQLQRLSFQLRRSNDREG